MIGHCLLLADVQTHIKINLQDTSIDSVIKGHCWQICCNLLNPKMTQTTPSLSLWTDTVDLPPITQKPYTLPPEYGQWVKDEFESLEMHTLFAKCLFLVKSCHNSS